MIHLRQKLKKFDAHYLMLLVFEKKIFDSVANVQTYIQTYLLIRRAIDASQIDVKYSMVVTFFCIIII